MSFKKSLLAIAVFEVIFCSAQAATVKYVDTFGKPMFALNFVNDYARQDEEGNLWSLTEDQRNAIVDAASIWGELFAKNSSNTTYLPISVKLAYEAGNMNNASAGSEVDVNSTYTLLQNGIITGRILDNNLAEYTINQSTKIGYMPYLYPVPTMEVTQELTTTTFHELSHALGILSETSTLTQVKDQWDNIKEDPDSEDLVNLLKVNHYLDDDNEFKQEITEETLKTTGVSNNMTAFASHLWSFMKINGNSAVEKTNEAPTQLKYLSWLSYSENPVADSFIVGPGQKSGVYFIGPNVNAVLNKALPGVPVNGMEKRNGFELSHLELAHSMMSHQNYRNYVTLMEAEMAVFQDIGYKIDRRNFYGSSLYSSGESDNKNHYTNTNPFYARNAEGTAYIAGKPNTATLGVGFHLYGSNNIVTQAADLLADGRGGTGIRSDGSGNTIIIPSSTRITANGDHGTGILMSYGKDNTIVSRGAIQATGTGGKAVAFDFGVNMLGEDEDSRGSYMRTVDGKKSDISGEVDGYELNLKGPLVSTFDLSGSLEGRYASIYIADNAYVEQINVLKGASIKGDIISEWDPKDKDISDSAPQNLYIDLNFGYGVKADGTSTGSGDSSFAMTLEGSIAGYKSLKINHAAGTLNIEGTVEAYELENSGYLAIKDSEDKYSALIKNNFTNNAKASLETGFYADSTTDKIRAATASLNGSWVLRPHRDFYRNNARISPEFPVVTTSAPISGSFAHVGLVGAFSPTLKMRLTDDSPTHPEIEMYRDINAYSQYAKSENDASVGRALYGISSVAMGDMQTLLTTLDFSDMSGRTVTSALSQLSPATYDYGTMTALKDSTTVTGEVMRHMQGTMLSSRYNNLYNSDTLMASNSYDLNSGLKGVSDRKVIGFFVPYGDFTKQKGSNGLDDMRSYSGGAVMGLECVRDDGITYGVHGGVSIRNTRISAENKSEIDSQGVFVGIHGSISPEEWGGFYADGQVRVGLYENQSKRQIYFDGYSRTPKGRYSSFNTGLMIGGGYDFTYGSLSFGPMVYTEYNFMHNQGFTEKNGYATNLKVKSSNNDSLQTTLGGHLLKMWSPSQEIGISADFRAGFKHEFLDDEFRTRASFSDYGAYSFDSYTKGAGKNSVFCQSELTLENRKFRTFASLTLGYEHHHNADIYNVGIKAGLRF
ncbi:Autotransporter beta-domain-containing protein [Succinivibrio dextrinosolvens]|uniref:autotransporter outer membrane beta-barrel domain-containing protein n=1 Tax=Succinivibrio dextrinosolvens TaxID=83771 RepID=UPI0008EF1F50|nr:autotransporter outer membrane beta-barrel domain-containing protein [Succinivibrio dextrinosolvens]SFS48493.1 Autotransporter beta-domain-containing protein [Succinivibrio dextrinosolvens]